MEKVISNDATTTKPVTAISQTAARLSFAAAAMSLVLLVGWGLSFATNLSQETPVFPAIREIGVLHYLAPRPLAPPHLQKIAEHFFGRLAGLSLRR